MAGQPGLTCFWRAGPKRARLARFSTPRDNG